MGDEDNREPLLLVKVADDAPQFLARERVECAERLVEHQQSRFVDQRTAQICALLHAAGKLPGIFRTEAGQADQFEHRLRPVDILRLVLAQSLGMRRHDLERQHDVVECRSPRQQRRILERHADDIQRPLHMPSVDGDAADLRHDQAGREFHQGRLAAAGRSHDGGELSFPHGHRQVLDGGHPTVPAIGQRHIVDGHEVGARLADDGLRLPVRQFLHRSVPTAQRGLIPQKRHWSSPVIPHAVTGRVFGQ